MMSECRSSLQERVVGALRGNPYFQDRDIIVLTRNETVILEGVLRSYYQKQMAQKLVAAVAGVRAVMNRIQVQAR